MHGELTLELDTSLILIIKDWELSEMYLYDARDIIVAISGKHP